MMSENKNIDVLCVGSTTIDVFIMLQKLQKFSYDKFSNHISFALGEKVPVDQYTIALGGNACNVSVGLSRLGFTASLAAEIGSDELSEKIPATLTKEGVDQTFLKREKTINPFFNIVLSYDGERTILEEKNPLGIDLEIGTLHSKLVFLASVRGNWQKAYEKVFSECREEKFALNPGTRQLMETRNDLIRILSYIDVLFLNVQEAQILLKETDPDIKTLLKKIKEFGVGNVVITDGINGSYAMDLNGDIFQIGVIGGKPFERTGAGDSYASGFLYGYLNGNEISECMKYGTLNADSVIKKIGSQEGLLTKEAIEEKFKSYDNLKASKI